MHAVLPEAVLVIAGLGSDWKAVADTVECAGLSNRVRFLGRVQSGAIPQAISESTVLCLPAKGEPLRMVLLESVSAASEGGARSTTAPDNGSRILAATPACLAHALVQILRTPVLTNADGQGPDRLRQSYSWRILLDWLESLYLEAIARVPGRARRDDRKAAPLRPRLR